MTVTTIDLVGDSEAEGSLFTGSQIVGGMGCWAELVAQRLGNISGIGPLLGAGFRSVGLAQETFATGEMAYAGSWTSVVSTDAHDKLPYGYGKTGNGSDRILTYTPCPVGSSYPPIVGFDYWWVDLAGGGNPSYSLDGGSGWTNFAETIVGNNGLKKCYIASAITSTLKVRCANAAGTGTLAFPAGITPYFSDPRSATTGIVLNNFGLIGETLHHLVQSTSGDRMAILDSVTLGSGSPISSNPTITLVLHINDVQLANSTQWGTDLTSLNTRASAVGTVGFLNMWAVETTDYNATQQINYRAQTKTTAAGLSPVVKVLDIFDAWSALGLTTLTSQAAAFLADSLHPSQAGHKDLARRVYWWLRTNNFSSTVGVPSSYTAIGKLAAVQCVGKQAAVQYAAGSQIAPIPV